MLGKRKEKMSQENFNKNDKFPRFQPNRDENNNKKGPRFSNYWIWAILLATVIGFAMFGPFSKKTQTITVSEFKDMLRKHHVERYVEIPNKNVVKVSIKKDSLAPYVSKLPNNAISNKKDDKPPQFSFESNERFREEILDFKKQNPADFPNDMDRVYDPYVAEKDSTWFSGILNILLPVLLFLAIWILLMRKMSGGAGAGGGPGGIFNIGKSKATLFDKGTKVSITFADVAGLDEAKRRIADRSTGHR
jgi:cell division protease FtsH